MPEEAIELGMADYVVVGEGEKTTQELIDAIEDNKTAEELAGIRGIVYKKGNKIINTGENDLICNLDELPYPAYDLVPIGLYRTSECMIPKAEKKAVHVLTSRGCPNNCSYCASPRLYRRRVRFRSVGNVMDELRYLGSLGIRWVHFHDDNFLLNKRRIIDLCDMMLKNKLKLEWTCLANTHTVASSPEILSLMKKAGCIGVEIGVESGDPEVFSHISKEQDIEEIRKAAAYIREAGLYAEYLMMAYNIGETIDSPYNSMRLLYEMNFGKRIEGHEIPLFDTEKMILMGHLARASPGSVFYDIAKREGMVLTKTWDDHFEENIGFIPNSFLDDRIHVIKRTDDVLKHIKIHEKQIRFYIDNCFYTSSYVLQGLGSLDELFLLMKKIYLGYDRKTVREALEKGDPKVVVSAVSILSLLRLIGSRQS